MSSKCIHLSITVQAEHAIYQESTLKFGFTTPLMQQSLDACSSTATSLFHLLPNQCLVCPVPPLCAPSLGFVSASPRRFNLHLVVVGPIRLVPPKSQDTNSLVDLAALRLVLSN